MKRRSILMEEPRKEKIYVVDRPIRIRAHNRPIKVRAHKTYRVIIYCSRGYLEFLYITSVFSCFNFQNQAFNIFLAISRIGSEI